MVQLTNLIIVLASGLAVTAFSLERRINNGHVARTNSLPSLKKSSTRLTKESRISTQLLSASEGSSELIAAASASSSATTDKSGGGSGGLFGAIWNENTKLSFYLIVWYLGNVYCK